MKTTILAITIAFMISALAYVMLYGQKAWSRELPSVVSPAYIPIGTSYAGKDNQFSMAWLLDTANQRILVCFEDMSHKETATPKCKYSDLPTN